MGGARVGVAAGLLMLLAVKLALAQDAAPPEPPPPPAAPEVVAKPGVFESIGRWLDQGASTFRDHLRGAKRRIDNLNDQAAANQKDLNNTAAEIGKGAASATKSAVDAVAKLPAARVMTGRERCVAAANGAPDCITAAEALCKKHGFASGKSIDFTSAEECPARALLAGRPAEAECTTVTFINRAMCQ